MTARGFRRCLAVAGLCAAAVAAFLLTRTPAPEEFRLHSAGPLEVIHGPEDLRLGNALEPIRLVAPRNGRCSAQAVATGGHLDGLHATVNDLESAGGAIIPADAIRIRYACKETRSSAIRINTEGSDRDQHEAEELYSNHPYYDVLADAPAPGATLVPIWVTVDVPADAAPGDYTGELTVRGHRVPISLHVSDWKAPDPAEFSTHVGFVQSPETLAATYGVPMWSEAHFELIGKSFEFMGDIGNWPLILTVLNRTHLGNEFAMVRWRRDGDGRLLPDLSVADRYLDLYNERAGTPRPLILYLWDPYLLYWNRRTKKRPPLPITVMGRDGKTSEQGVPDHGYPDADERMWRRLMDAVRAGAERRGWDKSVIMLGNPSDDRPRRDVIEFFGQIAPWAKWAVYTHGRGDPLVDPDSGTLVLDGMRIGYYEHPLPPYGGDRPDDPIARDWSVRRAFVMASNPRNFIYEYSPLSQFRCVSEATTITQHGPTNRYCRSADGFTRLGLDAWPVGDLRSYLCHRYRDGWGRFYRRAPRSLLAPGPDGPLGTVRFEMLREGILECEARTCIERALIAGEISGPLAERAGALLAERKAMCFNYDKIFAHFYDGNRSSPSDRLWGMAPDWQDSTTTLFDLAGKVTRAIADGG